MSEPVQDDLRQHERKKWWDEMNAYGRATVEAAGVRNEEDVVEAIHRTRPSRLACRKPSR